MDIKDFIKDTLIQINDGLEEAANKTGMNTGVDNNTNGVCFDMAVIVTTSAGKDSSSGAKVSIKVFSLGADRGKSEDESTSYSSRVKFNAYMN